jgi:hypothetical protein
LSSSFPEEERKQPELSFIFLLYPCTFAGTILSAAREEKVYYALISTSTPLGSSSFINASTVLDEDE